MPYCPIADAFIDDGVSTPRYRRPEESRRPDNFLPHDPQRDGVYSTLSGVKGSHPMYEIMISEEEAERITQDTAKRHGMDEIRLKWYTGSTRHLFAAAVTAGLVWLPAKQMIHAALGFFNTPSLNSAGITSLMAVLTAGLAWSAYSFYKHSKSPNHGEAYGSHTIGLDLAMAEKNLGEKFDPKKPVPLVALIHELTHTIINHKAQGMKKPPHAHGPLFTHVFLQELDHYDPTPGKALSREQAYQHDVFELTATHALKEGLVSDTPLWAREILETPLPSFKPPTLDFFMPTGDSRRPYVTPF